MADQLGLLGGASVAADGATAIPLVDAEPLRVWRRWAEDNAENWSQLRTPIRWTQGALQTPGGRVPIPRLEAFYSDRPAAYSYSGEVYNARELREVPRLGALAKAVEATTGHAFGAVFCNLYRGKQDSIGWHADDEPSLGPVHKIVIASVSFGAPRRFLLKHVASGKVTTVELGNGDLLLMGRGVQSAYVHAVPKSSQAIPERINLTYRRFP